jgi:UTP-glucose-1-phosphate uridylyltransferase
MLAIQIDNPLIEDYFKNDTKMIEKVLEYFVKNNLDKKLESSLNDVYLMSISKKEEKKARDFLDEL